MENLPNDIINSQESNTLKDYIRLIRNHLVPVILITLAGLIIAIIYAINATNIYRATSSLRLSKPQGGSVLTAPLMPEFQEWGNDRFIANEIEIMQSYRTREKVARALIDSFFHNPDKDQYYILLEEESKFSGKKRNLTISRSDPGIKCSIN